MKKIYTRPELQEISVQSSDILLASGEDTLIDVTNLFNNN